MFSITKGSHEGNNRKGWKGRVYTSCRSPFRMKMRQLAPFNPQSNSFGSYFSVEREGERERGGGNPQSRSCKCRVMPASFRVMGLRVRYLPRRETLCTDLRILRICSRVARWGRIRWYRRTTPIRRNALIMARSRLDHGSRSVVLIVYLSVYVH